MSKASISSGVFIVFVIYVVWRIVGDIRNIRLIRLQNKIEKMASEEQEKFFKENPEILKEDLEKYRKRNTKLSPLTTKIISLFAWGLIGTILLFSIIALIWTIILLKNE